MASKNNKLIRLRRISVFLPSSLLAGIQRRAFMNVEAFVTELPVEALDERVLHRSSWSNEVQLDRVLVRPLIEGLLVNSVPLFKVITLGRP